jgi:hypothetical protein
MDRPTLMRIAGTLALFLSLPISAKTALFVNAHADETLGQQLIYTLKESILRSASFELAAAEKDAVLVVYVQTVEVVKGRAIAFSVVLVANGFYLSSMVGSCPGPDIAACIPGVLAEIDSRVTMFHLAPASR